ncbi:DMT family transporter [Moraxella sp. ZJ142]|uniref:DMT family transporter n=1 Tax=Moraxella marmotae TaxID=3344520 RepID=UPI0035D4A2B9
MSDKKLIVLFVVFVLIWSSGFIVGRMIVGSVSPNIFLAIRFFGTAVLFFSIALLLKKQYPKFSEIPKHMVVGFLCNGIYLGGSYWAINHGMPAGIMALLGGLQPLITLVFGSVLFGERFKIDYIWGIIVGLFGVYLALPSSHQSPNQSYDFLVFLISVLSIVCITVGLLFQKYYIKSSELITSLVIQNLSGALMSVILATVLKESTFYVNFDFLFSLFWAVFVLSGVGVYLLMYLTKNHNAVKTTSLMLLCPPLAAIQANLLFDERLSLLQILGFAIALFGVALCQKVKA